MPGRRARSPLVRERELKLSESFAQDTLRPLYHDAGGASSLDHGRWDAYSSLNRRFAERAAEVVAANGLVWIHDYRLQVVPRYLRQLRPDMAIGFLSQIPFPPPELFMRLPWRDEIAASLLAADLVGFPRRIDADNFAVVAARLLGAEGRPPPRISSQRARSSHDSSRSDSPTRPSPTGSAGCRFVRNAPTPTPA